MYRKTSLIILTIILASILVPLITITTQAQEVTITSSLQIPQFYENQWFYVIITDPTLLDVAQNNWTVFINDVPFTVQKYYGALKFWVIYNTTPVALPANPNPEPGFDNNFIYLSKNLTLSSGDTVVIKYYSPAGPAYTFTLTYAPTSASISLDRTKYPGFNDTVVYVNVNDWDHNYDPTLVETYTLSLTITITWVNNTTTSKTITVNLAETSDNTGLFSGSYTLDYLLKQTFNLTDYYGAIEKIDYVVLSVTDAETGESSAAAFSLFFSRGQVSAPGTATYSSEILVTITDPDMNLDSAVEDVAKSYIEVIAGSGDSDIFYPIEESPDSGIFKAVIPITYNEAFNASGDGVIYVNVSQNNSVTVRYYDWDLASRSYKMIYERVIYIEAQPISIQTDKDKYLPRDKVELTIIDPNLNDNAALVESFPGITLVNGSVATIDLKIGTKTIAVLQILVNGVPATLNVPTTIYATITETGANTGEFILKYRDPVTLEWKTGFDLNWLGPLKDGDVVTFVFTNKITGTTATRSITITVPVPTVVTDRTEYPILASDEVTPGADKIRIYINVTDVFANVDPDKRDTITLEFYLYPDPKSALDLSAQGWTAVDTDADGVVDYWYLSVPVIESDIDSSLFPYVLEVPTTEWLLNAKLSIVYVSQWYPTPITKEIVFKPHTAKLEIVEDVSEVDGTVTIRLCEPDRNLDAFAIETVTVYLGGVPITLIETGINTSTFEATVRLNSTYVYVFSDRVYIVKSLMATYDDLMTAIAAYYVAPPGNPTPYIVNGFPTTVSDIVSIKTYTAEVYVSVVPPELLSSVDDILEVEYLGPIGSFYIYVYDPDLKLLGPEVPLTSASVISTLTAYARSAVDQDEVFYLGWTGIPGLFYVQVPIQIGSAATDGIIEVGGVGDNVTIKFVDPTGATGQQELVLKTYPVKAFDANIVVSVYRAGETIENPAYVLPDDIVTVTACDTETVQAILSGGDTYVKAYTTTDPVGRAYWYSYGTLQLTPEGCFEVTFRLDNSTSPIFKIGDTLTIAFRDLFAADGTAKEITVTLPIGKVEKYPIEPSLNVTEYKLINLATMQPVEKATPDVLLGVEIPIRNLNPWGIQYTVIAQIIKEGRIIAIGISGGYIGAGESGTAIAYIGYLEPGTYTVQVFIWQDIATMKPLSKTVVEFTLTVEG